MQLLQSRTQPESTAQTLSRSYKSSMGIKPDICLYKTYSQLAWNLDAITTHLEWHLHLFLYVSINLLAISSREPEDPKRLGPKGRQIMKRRNLFYKIISRSIWCNMHMEREEVLWVKIAIKIIWQSIGLFAFSHQHTSKNICKIVYISIYILLIKMVVKIYILIFLFWYPVVLFLSTPRFRFPLFFLLKESSNPWRKSIGESRLVTCLTNDMFRLATGCPSSSGSSSKHRLRLVSAGKEATMRRRLYFPASVRRCGSARSRLLVSSTRFGWLEGEKTLPSYRVKVQNGFNN